MRVKALLELLEWDTPQQPNLFKRFLLMQQDIFGLGVMLYQLMVPVQFELDVVGAVLGGEFGGAKTEQATAFWTSISSLEKPDPNDMATHCKAGVRAESSMEELITAKAQPDDQPGDLGDRLSQPNFWRYSRLWVSRRTYDELRVGGSTKWPPKAPPIGEGRGFNGGMKRLVMRMLADHPFKRPTAIGVAHELMRIRPQSPEEVLKMRVDLQPGVPGWEQDDIDVQEDQLMLKEVVQRPAVHVDDIDVQVDQQPDQMLKEVVNPPAVHGNL